MRSGAGAASGECAQCSLPSARDQDQQNRDRPPSSSLRLGIWGGGGGGGWRGSPSPWKGKGRNACGRAVCATGGTKKTVSVGGSTTGTGTANRGGEPIAPKMP